MNEIYVKSFKSIVQIFRLNLSDKLLLSCNFWVVKEINRNELGVSTNQINLTIKVSAYVWLCTCISLIEVQVAIREHTSCNQGKAAN